MSKTLVCIIAQTRSHEVTWENFNKNVLKELDADLALCIGVTKNYNYQNPFWKNAKHKWTMKNMEMIIQMLLIMLKKKSLGI